jgi:ceramide glucosyltransferase
MPSASEFFFIAAAGGTLYLALACLRLGAFARRPRKGATQPLPSVTILKPVAGLEPGLYENLASFCDQEYEGTYEVVFCLHDENDPALAVVRRLVQESAHCRARIALGENLALRNPKSPTSQSPACSRRARSS